MTAWVWSERSSRSSISVSLMPSSARGTTSVLYFWRVPVSQTHDLPGMQKVNASVSFVIVLGHLLTCALCMYILLLCVGESYCGDNNGGCSHICLPSPTFAKYSCSCPDNDRISAYRLNPDGKTCLTTPCQCLHNATFLLYELNIVSCAECCSMMRIR